MTRIITLVIIIEPHMVIQALATEKKHENKQNKTNFNLNLGRFSSFSDVT